MCIVEAGIRIEVVWFDDGVVSLQVSGSNGRFAGSVELYASHDSLPKLAKAIRGFPVSVKDVREFELGTFDETYAGGGTRMQFLCTDKVGHTAVKIKMRTDPRTLLGQTESAVFLIEVEPAGIDNFVRQLDNMQVELGSTVCLQRLLT